MEESVRLVLRNPRNKSFASVLRTVMAYGYGQPTKQVEATELPAVLRYPEPVANTQEWGVSGQVE